MDSRKDEQERGITMKSSSIALLHNKGKCYCIWTDMYRMLFLIWYIPVCTVENNSCLPSNLTEVSSCISVIAFYVLAPRLKPSVRVLANMFLERERKEKVLYIPNLKYCHALVTRHGVRIDNLIY
jgi:hypothetical protein